MHVVDNVTVALLTQVNELASKCGLRPCDFIARAGTDDDAKTILRFEWAVGQELKLPNPRMERMLNLLGLSPRHPELVGSDEQVLDAVERALQQAQRGRGRY